MNESRYTLDAEIDGAWGVIYRVDHDGLNRETYLVKTDLFKSNGGQR